MIFLNDPWLSRGLADIHSFSHIFCSKVDIGLDPEITLDHFLGAILLNTIGKRGNLRKENRVGNRGSQNK